MKKSCEKLQLPSFIGNKYYGDQVRDSWQGIDKFLSKQFATHCSVTENPFRKKCDRKGVLLFPHLLLLITNVFPKSSLPFCIDLEIVLALELVSSMFSLFLSGSVK